VQHTAIGSLAPCGRQIEIGPGRGSRRRSRASQVLRGSTITAGYGVSAIWITRSRWRKIATCQGQAIGNFRRRSGRL